MNGAERAKLSRIRAKPPEKRTAEDFAWHAELEARYQKSISLEIEPNTAPGSDAAKEPTDPPSGVTPRPSTPPNPGIGTGTGPAPGSDDEWDQVIDTTAGDDDDDDDDDEPVAPRGQGASAPRAGGAGPAVPAAPAPMSLEVSRGTASSLFLLNSSAWSLLGDRDPRYLEPSDEEQRLLSKVFASYAERYGWTKELDDAILLGTVLLVYNARAFRAPRKQPKAPKLPAGEK